MPIFAKPSQAKTIKIPKHAEEKNLVKATYHSERYMSVKQNTSLHPNPFYSILSGCYTLPPPAHHLYFHYLGHQRTTTFLQIQLQVIRTVL